MAAPDLQDCILRLHKVNGEAWRTAQIASVVYQRERVNFRVLRTSGNVAGFVPQFQVNGGDWESLKFTGEGSQEAVRTAREAASVLSIGAIASRKRLSEIVGE